MNIKASAMAVFVALVLALGGYWYYSPFMSLKTMQTAAQQQDADTFNQYVDYSRVRDSLKEQMSALLGEQLGAERQSGPDSLGVLLGRAVINPLVDALVRPEVVMRAMNSGEFKPAVQSSGSGSSPAKMDEIQWQIERQTLNRVKAYAMEPGSTERSTALGMVFERDGFFRWKLIELRLPTQGKR